MHKHEVISLGAGDREVMTSVLAEAFRTDPAFIPLFRHRAPGRDLYYRRFMRLWVDYSLREDHLLLGVKVNDRLAGVVGVGGADEEDGARWSIRYILPVMLMIIPGMDVGVGLFLLRASAPPKHIPPSACELSMLAVDPEFQGLGIARALITSVQEHIAQMNAVSGIYLYTTEPGALRFYENNGFACQATVTRVGIDVHHLYWESAKSAPRHQC